MCLLRVFFGKNNKNTKILNILECFLSPGRSGWWQMQQKDVVAKESHWDIS